MADVKENGLCLIEFEQSFFSGVVNSGAYLLGSLFDFGDGVSLVGVEHEAGGTDHAALLSKYQ